MISRYEIKFRINHEQKRRFLAAARFGLRDDPHGRDACYRVTSVYFDSPALDFYWEKVNGESIRKKLRLRYYGDVSEGLSLVDRVCYLELKHRVKDTVLKERVRLTSDGAQTILDDPQQLRSVGELTAESDRHHLQTIRAIERLGAQLNCRAANVISYRREAWIGRVDDRLRVTFDDDGTAHDPACDASALLDAGTRVIPDGHYVMEVKFNSAFPRWIRDIIAQQHLLPRRFSKYAAGIESLSRMPPHPLGHTWSIPSADAEQNTTVSAGGAAQGDQPRIHNAIV